MTASLVRQILQRFNAIVEFYGEVIMSHELVDKPSKHDSVVNVLVCSRNERDRNRPINDEKRSVPGDATPIRAQFVAQLISVGMYGIDLMRLNLEVTNRDPYGEYIGVRRNKISETLYGLIVKIRIPTAAIHKSIGVEAKQWLLLGPCGGTQKRCFHSFPFQIGQRHQIGTGR